MWRHVGLAILLLGGCGEDGGEEGAAPAVEAAAGPDPFDERVLATYEIALDPAEWDRLVADPFDNTWRRCVVTWQGETYADVALRPSGERSRIAGNPKPSLRLEFDEFVPGREFHGFSTLKLDALIHDRSMMRARLEYPVYEALGIPAPRYVHARVLVNAALKGLYGVEERVGKEFVRKRFGRPVGQLYEYVAEGSGKDVRWSGPETWRYVPWMWWPKIEELPDGAEAVRDLVDVLNNDPGAAPEVFDVESFLRFIAAETALGEGDAYVAGEEADGSENMFLYRPPTSGTFMLLPWDRDQGFWREETSITFGFDRRILTRNLILGNPANLARYREILREVLAGPLEPARFGSRVDIILAQIRGAALEDRLKPYEDEAVLESAGRIKEYAAARREAFLAQLAGP